MITKPLTDAEKKELIAFVHTLPRPRRWELFSTVTFKHRHGLFEASEAYRKFVDHHVPWISHFWAVERNPSGDGGHHVHALWAGTEDLERNAIWAKAFHQLGRSRIEPIRKNSDVTMYCTKYVAVDGALIEWRINGGGDSQRRLFRPDPKKRRRPHEPRAPRRVFRKSGWIPLAEYELRRSLRTPRPEQLPLSPNDSQQ
jgi:hypothetical protein